jgi:hypothetical protein
VAVPERRDGDRVAYGLDLQGRVAAESALSRQLSVAGCQLSFLGNNCASFFLPRKDFQIFWRLFSQLSAYNGERSR